MATTSPTAPATVRAPDLSHLVEEALDAFWDVVTDHYPLVKTGDLSPETASALETAAEKAVEGWVKHNAVRTA